LDRSGAIAEDANFFEDLEDPRTGNAKLHPPHEVLVIALCTVLYGGKTCADMALFGRSKEEFLRLERSISSHDAFSRLFLLLDPERFHAWSSEADAPLIHSVDSKGGSFGEGLK
jgi:hypothetical protein